MVYYGSYIKRKAEGSKGDDQVGEVAINMVHEVIAKVKDENLVKGHWHVIKTKKDIVWCDASSIAIGTVLEVDGKVVEDSHGWERRMISVI